MLQWFAQLNYQGYKGTTPYQLDYPDWFIGSMAVPKVNLTQEAVELGRFLFYDKSLSADSSVACASCHRQEVNFADSRRFSVGAYGRIGVRNSMPLVNLVLDKRFFWDGRAGSLEEQIRNPITGSREMDLPFSELVRRLTMHPIYPALFERAYGERKITEERIVDALAQFVKSIISYSMPEDYFRAAQDGRIPKSQIPQEFRQYWGLFQQTQVNSNCGPCHQQALQMGQNRFENINPHNSSDAGYMAVTKKKEDFGKFKVLALRNIALTAPYMHDGSVTTLREALTHYRAGRFSSNNPNDPYRDEYGNPRTDSLSKNTVDLYEKAYMVNIDRKVLTDPRYSNPF
ncbi:MAG: hypothetical protein N2Z22_07945 [Turneriella sp.]|nr:hypothetical protein [Turneriella sp.]